MSKKIEQMQLLVEIPLSLNQEIQKYLMNRAKGKSLQGSRKVFVNQAILNYLMDRHHKIRNGAQEETVEIINRSRFDI
jgi:hypothetical protein